jgi:hypothetical protein
MPAGVASVMKEPAGIVQDRTEIVIVVFLDDRRPRVLVLDVVGASLGCAAAAPTGLVFPDADAAWRDENVLQR